MIFSLEEGNPTVHKIIDEGRGHYAKWNKSDREGQTLHGITYMWILKIEKKIK